MFSIKTVRVTAQLQKGQFSGSGNTVVIENLPITIDITKQGGEDKNKAEITIENLRLDTVKQLTVLSFKRLETYNNVVKIEAGNKGTELSTIFSGEVTSSIPEISNNGTLSLKMEVMAGYYPALIPAKPVSVQGATTIEKLMAQFAKEAGYDFENKNITGSVSNCVFIGSPIAKARTLARQTGIDLLIDNNKFTIQTFNAPKDGAIPLISAKNGMIGYPSFSSDGIDVKCEFNSNLNVGGYFKLDTILPFASGEWQIVKLTHHLEAYKPNSGAWETTVSGVLPGSDTSAK
jgi:hypothetical protein|nr:MAG TPA: tail protein [Caudoviricetes sp.]